MSTASYMPSAAAPSSSVANIAATSHVNARAVIGTART
jgi:hypothetical protein